MMSGQAKQKKDNRTMSNLQKFLTSYGNYLTQNSTINMDIESVLHDVSTNILEPNTEDEEIIRLHHRGVTLKKDVANDIIPKLRSLKEDKLYEVILSIEQLNQQLNRQYEQQVKRGIDLGIYDKNDKQTSK